METFFKVKTPVEVFSILNGFEPVDEETLPVEKTFSRILAQDIHAPEDLPGFFRSIVDGYAVRARDTYGASESLPALLEIQGEILMGQNPDVYVSHGKAMKISTGGMLPQGADGIAMIEFCHLIDENTLEISKTVSPLENVIQPGDDFKAGEKVLEKGSLLRPQDIGVLAGLGLGEIPVFRKPRIAVISTGDELVSIDCKPDSGQVRDINRYTLGALCEKYGAEPLFLGMCADDFSSLKTMVEEGLRIADSVWLSGGSSVGTKDLTLSVLETLPDFELLVHGISISPGKPTIIAKSGLKSIIGFPGHTASALVVAEVFFSRLLANLAGIKTSRSFIQPTIEAELSRNVESSSGREDYIRVRLFDSGDKMIAEPLFGKSGLISTLVDAHGLVKIDLNTEGIYQGQKVEVILLNSIQGTYL